MPMKRLALCLGFDQYAKLKARAQRTGLTMAELIRRAIDAYLQREKE